MRDKRKRYEYANTDNFRHVEYSYNISRLIFPRILEIHSAFYVPISGCKEKNN